MSLLTSIVSWWIKIPKGIANFGTLIYDAATGDGLDVDLSLTERFNRDLKKLFLVNRKSSRGLQARINSCWTFNRSIFTIIWWC